MKAHIKEVVIELSPNEEGIIAIETISVQVHNLGGGEFISISTSNLEPDSEFDAHTVCIGSTIEEIDELANCLKEIVRQLATPERKSDE